MEPKKKCLCSGNPHCWQHCFSSQILQEQWFRQKADGEFFLYWASQPGGNAFVGRNIKSKLVGFVYLVMFDIVCHGIRHDVKSSSIWEICLLTFQTPFSNSKINSKTTSCSKAPGPGTARVKWVGENRS